MVNKKYLSGRRKEQELKLLFQVLRFHVTRSSGSKGQYDLIAGKGPRTIAIQCKAKTVTKKEREALREASDKWYVEHLMAWKEGGEWKLTCFYMGDEDKNSAAETSNQIKAAQATLRVAQRVKKEKHPAPKEPGQEAQG